MYKLEHQYLIRDTTDNYFHHRHMLDSGVINGDTLTKESFESAKVLFDELPYRLMTSSSRSFGSPDNHDQCGIYIQIRAGNEIKIFTIDTELDKIPFDIEKFAKVVMELDRTIQN